MGQAVGEVAAVVHQGLARRQPQPLTAVEELGPHRRAVQLRGRQLGHARQQGLRLALREPLGHQEAEVGAPALGRGGRHDGGSGAACR